MLELLPAFCVGLSETLVGYPFLTAKVRIQNGLPWRNLKIRQYYQGVKYPACSSFAFNLVVFPMHERMYKKTNSHALAGAIAGIVVTPQAFVIDTLAITRQTNQQVSIRLFKPPIGGFSTMVREVIALSSYFETYHQLRDQTGSFIAGGAAGLFNWTLSYPIDVVRSRQIAQRIPAFEAFKGGHLWKGFRIAAIRATIVNAVSFTVYEQTKLLIE